jgi:glucose-6-phosphate 1-dehydrogenase
MPESSSVPTILVIFGATGDLMGRKIIPSIHYLYETGCLPDHFHVVGFSRRDITDEEFREQVGERLAERREVDLSDEATSGFLAQFHYEQGAFDDLEAYARLREQIDVVDGDWDDCANRLFYLAVPPRFYETIFRNLAASGLTRACSEEEGWTRVLVEKPFGKDARTAQDLDELLGSLFREEQIYRIDHYLAKEMLQGIMAFRFQNNLLETVWSKEGVESIEITLHETLGVEDRGTFYDGVGALRDVGQNHFLQMLALIAMDQPASLTAPAIRAKRAGLLGSLRRLTDAQIAQDTYRAQYEGYRDVDGVEPDSDTETFFKVKLGIDHPRWKGVPVTLQGGKCIDDVDKQIVVTFRHPMPCLCEGEEHHQNRVVFSLEPQDSITIEFFTKKPGLERETERREFDFFLYEKEEKLQYVEEYSKILLDAIEGDQTLFVSTDEVRSMWEFTDPIVNSWRAGSVPLATYAPGTDQAIQESAIIDVSTVRVSPMKREIGIVGLGKMGAGLARNLLDDGWRVVGANRSEEVTKELEGEGLVGAYSPRELVEALAPPRVVWLMLPAGKVTDDAVFGAGGYAEHMESGDILIDGANSFYEDDLARAPRLGEIGIRYVDVGVSGGPSGARNGACLMIGGDRDTFVELDMLWGDLAVERGYQFFDGVGAGHFVKMVHNGIEYGMMQSIAEGFAIMKASRYGPDLVRVADVYDHGSVIEASLMTWLRNAYEIHGEDLDRISGTVGHTGEGEWTAQVARELGVDARAIEGAFRFRVESEDDPSYAGKVLSALRNQFGGHKAT